jgi:hypothetical protein
MLRIVEELQPAPLGAVFFCAVAIRQFFSQLGIDQPTVIIADLATILASMTILE